MADLSRRSFIGGTLLVAAAQPALAGEQPVPPATDPVVPPPLPAEIVPPAAVIVGPPAGSVPVQFDLNGTHFAFDVDPDESALEVVRRRCSLTGTKQGCGAGTCGACTVIVDGLTHTSCLLPATALHDRKVTTVEGLGTADLAGMHPVQRAFLAQDAMQCGYCTPGFVVESAVFHDRWRQTHGTREPTRDEVSAALAGHLCRCGAYENIIAAVTAACRGEHDGPDVVYDRLDGPEKVTGRATFTVDVAMAGLQEAAIYRSPYAHARLQGLDDSAARSMPGVSGVLRLVSIGGLVRYCGQEVAAIAAVDRQTAERAVQALVAQWEILPAVTTMEAAQKPGAPLVYPRKSDARDAPAAAEGPVLPSGWEGNLRGPVSMSVLARPKQGRKGVDDALRTGTVGSGIWRTQAQLHTALEPHAAVARWPASDSIELWAGTQAVFWLGEDIAQRFDIPAENVIVHTPYVGGGFGAKVGLQMESFVAIELSRVIQAPVRVVLSRPDELMVGGMRPAQQVELAVGMSINGSMIGLTQRAYGDVGVSIGNQIGYLTRLVYDTPNKDLDDYDIVTHTPPAKPMRGPGGPQAFFALEGAIDAIAHQSGEDPIVVRRRFDPNPIRNLLYTWAEELPIWKGRGSVGQETGRYRRGVGLAAGGWFDFWDPNTQVELEASESGFVVRCGTQDIGTGSRTVLATAVAGVLGITPQEIRVEVGDSRHVHGPAAAGSRSTSSITPAAEDAAERLIAELVDLAKDRGIGEVAVLGGIEGTGGKVVGWKEVLAGASTVRVVGKRRKDSQSALIPIALFDTKVGRSFPGIVNVTEVELDTRLGRLRVVEGWAGVGVGRIVCPRLAQSQIEGAFIQNIGFALYEERRLDAATGRLLSHNLDDYKIPGIGDSPPYHVHFENRGFEHVRGGAVGLGEIGGVAVAASIANAFHHATGKRVYRLPINVPSVFQVLA